jgi:SAM-dependent methyltransferase
MSELISPHYDDKYFAWQAPLGEFGGWANQTKFAPYVTPQSRVLDFGCGGGYLLKGMNCATKVGVEVNPAAMEQARSNGLEVFGSVESVPDDYVDVIVSDNALEHTLHPLREVQALYKKLKPAGKIIFVVPCENISSFYEPNDVNHHLYSWSPMCIGNLFTEAGFSVIESKPYIHKWPPNFDRYVKLGGRRLFEIACRVYGRWERSWFQVRVVAEKKAA